MNIADYTDEHIQEHLDACVGTTEPPGSLSWEEWFCYDGLTRDQLNYLCPELTPAHVRKALADRAYSEEAELIAAISYDVHDEEWLNAIRAFKEYVVALRLKAKQVYDEESLPGFVEEAFARYIAR